MPDGYTIMSAISDSKKTTAKMMVMRSRFFSMMLVPVWVEYIELAIMSEMPVPLPECMRMKMIRPTPDRTSRTKKTITRGFNVSRFLYVSSVLRTQVD